MGDVRELPCTTARDFVHMLDPSNELWTNDESWRHHWIFRGQANIENRRLIPNAFRTGEARSFEMKHSLKVGVAKIEPASSFLQAHYKLVEHFGSERVLDWLVQLYAEITNLREYIDLASSARQGGAWPILTEFPMFGTDFAQKYVEQLENREFALELWGTVAAAIAQHHGLATRLLDFTRNPFYAAFFATENLNGSPVDIAVYAVHTFHLRKRVRLVEVSRAHSDYIHAQDGVFTLDTEADKSFLETGNWPCLSEAYESTLYKLTLPASEVKELIRILWLRHITCAHMMPTTDNVISALKNKWLWQYGNEQE